MKSFLSLATCVSVGLLVALSGCAAPPAQTARPLSQKPAASPTASYAPYAGGQIATAPRAAAPVTPAPVAPVMPAPLPPPAQTKLRVALLLPLTGRNAELGQALLNAAQQAVFDAAEANFELQPRDTAAQGAEVAARAALSGGAQLIIGPLFAADVPPVTGVAQSAGVPLLTLSTDTSLAERGVYVMGLAPGAQVERVVAYAAAHGARRFAALIPATPYGALVGEVFRNAVARAGGNVTDDETFTPSPSEIADRVKRLSAQRDQIDALFLPETGGELKSIADQLTAAGFAPAQIHILGTGLWDEQGLGQNPLLNGGWYAAPDPAARRAFIAAYAAAYGKQPPRLATLAYDATALAAVIAKQGSRYDQAALTNPNGFAGLDGIFRLYPSGEVERAMAVLELTPQGERVIDPAPASFVGRQ